MVVEGEAAKAEFVQGKISVWWDIENCQVPKGSDVNSIAKNIQSALVNMGYCGPISISAYGKTDVIPKSVQDALTSTGISLISVPPGVKDASDKKILVDMLFWAVDNPAPANYLLISGDRDFSNALHQLSMRKYNILLAQPQRASAPLVAAATSVWLWTSLSKGGPPLSKSESLLSVQNSIVSSPNSDSLRNSVSESTLVSKPVDSLYESSLQKSSSMGKGAEFKNKGKQLQKKVIQIYIPKASVAPTAIHEDHSNAKLYKYPLETPSVYTPSPQFSGQISNEISQFSQQTRPNNVTSQSSFRPSNVLTHGVHVSASRPVPPKPEDPRFSTGFPTNISDIGKPNISGTFQNGQNISFTNHHNQSTGQISNGTNGNTPQHNLLNQSSQPMRSNNVAYRPIFQPGNMLTPDAHIRACSSMPPRPEGPRFNLGFPTNIPDIGKLNISGNPQNSQNVSSFAPQNGPYYRFILPNHVNPQGQNVGNSGSYFNGNSVGSDFLSSSSSGTSTGMISTDGEWRNLKYPRPSDYMQGLGGIVLIALNTLKNEKIMPTEVNITGCIYYGDDLGNSNIDVRKALDSAVQQQMVTKHMVGALQFYIRKNEKLWYCVNPLGGNPNQYPKAKWDLIQNFLASAAGKSAILASHCRYEAATIMKKMCLKDLYLGDVIHILHLVVDVKRWITHLSSGWQPLQITLPEASPYLGSVPGP